MIPLGQAQQIIREVLKNRRVGRELLLVRDAAGRILAADSISVIDIPPFDRSAMDGFALLTDDFREEYEIIETVRAGFAPRLPLRPGACTKIMTGAPVPSGSGCVIPVENVQEYEGKMRILKPGRSINISRRGEDLRQGSVIARAGDRIDPELLPALMSCGVTQVEVYRRVRSTVLSTGDELVSSPADLAPGKIFDSNGPMLETLLRNYGAEVLFRRHIPDDRELTLTGLRLAVECSDIVFLTGGVSAGEYDFIPETLKELGLTIHFSRLQVKPGKPATFASDSRHLVLALPGNPVSAYLMFHLLGIPVMDRLSDRNTEPRWITMQLEASYRRKSTERLEFVPCRLTGNARIEPIPFHGSAHIDALRHADGFMLVDPGVDHLPEGHTTAFWLMNPHLFRKENSR